MNDAAVSGSFSFPKWAMGAFTVMVFALAGYTYNAGINNTKDIAVLEQRSAFSQQERNELREELKEMKIQLNRIEQNQSNQDFNQNLMMERLLTEKKTK